MQAREVRNDGGFPAAAFANNGTAVGFGRSIVTVKACLDSRNGGFEQRVFDQHAQTAPWIPSLAFFHA
jgi:hypothetical protein